MRKSPNKTMVFLEFDPNGSGAWLLDVVTQDADINVFYERPFTLIGTENGVSIYKYKDGLIAECCPKDVRKAKLILLWHMKNTEHENAMRAKSTLENAEKTIGIIEKYEAETKKNKRNSGEFVTRLHMKIDEHGSLQFVSTEKVPIENDLPPVEVRCEGLEVVGECYEDQKLRCMCLMMQKREKQETDFVLGKLKEAAERKAETHMV